MCVCAFLEPRSTTVHRSVLAGVYRIDRVLLHLDAERKKDRYVFMCACIYASHRYVTRNLSHAGPRDRFKGSRIPMRARAALIVHKVKRILIRSLW